MLESGGKGASQFITFWCTSSLDLHNTLEQSGLGVHLQKWHRKNVNILYEMETLFFEEVRSFTVCVVTYWLSFTNL